MIGGPIGRIYAEAQIGRDANELAFEVAEVAYEIIRGVGGSKPGPCVAEYGLRLN